LTENYLRVKETQRKAKSKGKSQIAEVKTLHIAEAEYQIEAALTSSI